jgi:hypothetical protein
MTLLFNRTIGEAGAALLSAITMAPQVKTGHRFVIIRIMGPARG